MIIAVDFDGTICEHKYPKIGEERPFATEILRQLIAERYKVVLWTMRTGDLLEEAIKWCEERGVYFYAVNNENSDLFDEKRGAGLSCKLNADIFIDDRNLVAIILAGSYCGINTHMSHHSRNNYMCYTLFLKILLQLRSKK